MNNINKQELISLAFSMHSNKGVYAVFLGSGVSMAAGIPTGWDIVKDLTKKLALVHGEDVADSIAWYQQKFSKEADYSDLLGNLSNTSAERNGLMRPYFEPSDDDEQDGTKQPTRAHRAIAKLMKDGYVKVVVTTNFDRLLEKALAELNVTPQVINTEYDIEGAVPLVHAECTIVKINGDYMDCRFKNTLDELSGYSEKWENYLSRILEDFGLITCGWSAKWDKALVNIIRGKLNRRYSSTFTYPINSDGSALKELADFKGGKLLPIQSADKFFEDLLEDVLALEQTNRNVPLSSEIAVARLKKYIVNPQGIIKLHDLFEDEVELTIQNLNKKIVANEECSPDLFNEIQKVAEDSTAILIPMLIEAIHWCKTEEHEDIIVNAMDKILNREINRYNGNRYTASLNYFTPALVLYVCCTNCIRFKKYHLLNRLLTIELTSRQFGYSGIDNGAAIVRYNSWLIDRGAPVATCRYYYPINSLILNWLENNSGYANLKSDYFIFEKIVSYYYGFLAPHNTKERGIMCIPGGLYQDASSYDEGYTLMAKFFDCIEAEKDYSDFIKQGMFKGSYAFYTQIKSQVDEFLKQHGRWQ